MIMLYKVRILNYQRECMIGKQTETEIRYACLHEAKIGRRLVNGDTLKRHSPDTLIYTDI